MGNEVREQSNTFLVNLARLSSSNYFSPYRVGGENINIVKLNFIFAAFISFQGTMHDIMEARNSNYILCYLLAVAMWVLV